MTSVPADEYGINGQYVGVPVKLGRKGIEQIAVKEMCAVIGV